MASSLSRTRSPYSSASSTSSSHINNNNRLLPRSSSTSSSTIYNSAGLGSSRSMTTSRTISDPGALGSGYYGPQSPLPYPSEGLIGDSVPTITSERDSISVTVRFRPMSEREYQRGDEIAWYPEENMVRNEYNPLTAYAFDKVFGPQATTVEVYDVAAKPVVKSAMEGVNGTVFAYGVTSSGKTHTMHARMQEMKEKEMKSQAAAAANAEASSHICKVCLEAPTATILLPCRHFCLCKCCSLSSSECPICRTKISDRLFAFPS